MLQFDCTACKHHRPSPDLARAATAFRNAGIQGLAVAADSTADAFGRCQLTGEYCDLERTGGKLGALLTGRCGKAARFMEPK